MSWLNVYLLSGLVLHKLVWEILKRRSGRPAVKTNVVETAGQRIVKFVKIAILLGIVVQTMLPTVFPIVNAPRQLVWLGVAIYTVGLGLALSARFELGRNWSDIEVGTIREDHRIVESGVYRHVRHPIYVGDLALLVGLELALNSWLVVGAILLIPIVLRKALNEERTLVKSLPGYAEYCARTRPFVGLRST